MRKTEYEITFPVNGVIALVTDLHEHDPEPVLEILREVKPDVIAVAGDTLERHHRGEKLDKGDRSLASRLICAGIQAAEKLGGLLHTSLLFDVLSVVRSSLRRILNRQQIGGKASVMIQSERHRQSKSILRRVS